MKLEIPQEYEHLNTFFEVAPKLFHILTPRVPETKELLKKAISLLTPFYMIKFPNKTNPQVTSVLSITVANAYRDALLLLSYHKLFIEDKKFSSQQILDALKTAILFQQGEMIKLLLDASRITFENNDARE